MASKTFIFCGKCGQKFEKSQVIMVDSRYGHCHVECPEDIKYPICPVNMYFEGDEDKCDTSKCDYNVETRSCSEACRIPKALDYHEIDERAWKIPKQKGDKNMAGDKKPTNPKDALGIEKVPLHCIPCGPLLELGLAMMEGGRKYGTHNYRPMGVRASVYYNAAMRHLIDWWEGEDIDPDSGVHHVIKAIASLFVVRDSMLMDNYDDDRPVTYPNGLNISKFNEQAAEIIRKYPTCADPFIEKHYNEGGDQN